MITTLPSYYNPLWNSASERLFWLVFSRRGNSKVSNYITWGFQWHFPASDSQAVTCLEKCCKAPRFFNTSCLCISFLTQRKSWHNWLLAHRREAYQESKKCDRPVVPTHFVFFFLFSCSSVSHCFMPWLESIGFSSCSSVNLVLIFRETATGSFIKLTFYCLKVRIWRILNFSRVQMSEEFKQHMCCIRGGEEKKNQLQKPYIAITEQCSSISSRNKSGVVRIFYIFSTTYITWISLALVWLNVHRPVLSMIHLKQ